LIKEKKEETNILSCISLMDVDGVPSAYEESGLAVI
jgi:hypothetical protein